MAVHRFPHSGCQALRRDGTTVFVDEIVAAVNHVDIASGTEGGAGALQPPGVGQIVGIQEQYKGRAQLSGRTYAQVTRQPGAEPAIGIDDSPPRSQCRLDLTQVSQRHFTPGVIVHDDQHSPVAAYWSLPPAVA